MQVDYTNDGHGLASDFPSDPVFPWELLLGVVGLALFLLVLGGLFIFFQRLGQQMAERASDDAIVKKVELVSKALSNAARAPRDQQEGKLRLAVEEVDKHFGATLAAAAGVTKAVGGMNTSLEGLVKKDTAPANGLFPNGSHVQGNTIINIAVNNGEIGHGASGSGPIGANPAPVPDSDIEISPRERREIVWEAVQRLFDYWKFRAAVVAQIRAVRVQLDTSPAWTPPRENERMRPVFGKRDEAS
ncbi:hypothetical protein [Asticcacaulis sp. AC402]|uniref:hypothetical protein n=1 Tax=Asticcacaulis sp. AC402 TaxID=1282361 RepID=UPI0003C3F592|nr:hypothetical protein [Asticcacaulis sp. AC402]ESQ76667.1 hypothetical protein ABAC402_03045 [Asticcacaulis sp. AC402]